VDLLGAPRAHGISTIVHLAYVLGAESNAASELATRVNIMGTANVLEAARLAGVGRVLVASSIAVYGADGRYSPGELPRREDVPLYVAEGLPLYGGSKVYMGHLGSHYAGRYGVVVAGLPPSIVYVWGRQRGATVFAGQLVERAVTGEPVSVGFGDARVSLVHVEDVADQFLALLEADPALLARRRLFKPGEDTCTVRELVETVRRVLPEARIEVQSAGERDVAGLAASVSDAALREELGVHRKFTPLEVGLQAQINVARARSGSRPMT